MREASPGPARSGDTQSDHRPPPQHPAAGESPPQLTFNTFRSDMAATSLNCQCQPATVPRTASHFRQVAPPTPVSHWSNGPGPASARLLLAVLAICQWAVPADVSPPVRRGRRRGSGGEEAAGERPALLPKGIDSYFLLKTEDSESLTYGLLF